MDKPHEVAASFWKFIIVAFVIPALYVIVNAGIRDLVSGESKAENRYLGVDLALAAFVSVGLYAVEPATRLLPVMRWESPYMVDFKNQYGLDVAIVINFVILIVSMAIHRDFIKNHSVIKNPTRWQKFYTGFKNGFYNNLLGLLSFSASAFLMRG